MLLQPPEEHVILQVSSHIICAPNAAPYPSKVEENDVGVKFIIEFCAEYAPWDSIIPADVISDWAHDWDPGQFSWPSESTDIVVS